MSRSSPPHLPAIPATTWDELEQRLDRLLREVHSAPAETFRADFLRSLGLAVGAVGAIWWRKEPATRVTSQNAPLQAASFTACIILEPIWREEARWEFSDGSLSSVLQPDDASHRLVVTQRIGQSTIEIRPLQESRADGPTLSSALATIRIDDQIAGGIEVLFTGECGRPRAVPEHDPGHLGRVLAAYLEIAGDFQRREQSEGVKRQLRREQAASLFARDLVRETHATTLVSMITHGVANQLECDRAALVVHDGPSRVVGISRSESFDRRSPVVRVWERLGRLYREQFTPLVRCAGGQVFESSVAGEKPGEDRPASEEEAWAEYWEESTARHVVLWPLRDAGAGEQEPEDAASSPLGMLIVERFSEIPFDDDQWLLLDRLAVQAAAALVRVRRIDRQRWFAWLRRPSIGLFLAVILVMVGVGVYPIDFELPARGELQPRIRRDVFAPLDGVVRELHLKDGADVREGEILLTLANDDLEFEQTRVDGELQTTRRQLATVVSSRLEATPPGGPVGPGKDPRGTLAGEEERLKQVIRGLERQAELLRKRRVELDVTAPLAGRVVTPNVEQRLRARPLRRGQHLCTIVRESGEWELDLRVADRDIGHLVAARAANPAVPLRFALANTPAETRPGQITRISEWTELDPHGDPVVRVTAELVGDEGRLARAGTTVHARIHCGRRPLAVVWLRDFWELIRTRWLI